eukprot:2119999-Rhodomonas_salina.1
MPTSVPQTRKSKHLEAACAPQRAKVLRLAPSRGLWDRSHRRGWARSCAAAPGGRPCPTADAHQARCRKSASNAR